MAGAGLAGPDRLGGARHRRWLAIVAVPILMLTRPRPLIPPSLFKSRNFTVVNLSTFVIYGALYVTLAFRAGLLQGTLGYTPLAAGRGRACPPRCC